METTAYTLIQWGFALLTLTCVGLVLFGLWRALEKAPYNQSRKRKIFWQTMLVMLGWLGLVSVLSLRGFYQDFSAIPPRFAFLVLPPLAAVVVLCYSKGFRQLLAYVPPAWRIPASLSFFVELLLWALFVQNLVPEQMTFEGRNWDILVGITAGFVGYFCLVKGRWPVSIAFWWNIAGLLLVFNIAAVAILSAPTPFRVFMNEPANTIVTYFPIVWLPAVLVPLAFALHFFSLHQLRMKTRRDRTESTRVVV
jgi:hypothetical protein